LQQAPSIGWPLALESVQAIGIGQCAVDIVGERNLIGVCGAQATGDHVTWPDAEAPLQALAGVYERVGKDIGSVHPDVDGHVVDRALDPSGYLGHDESSSRTSQVPGTCSDGAAYAGRHRDPHLDGRHWRNDGARAPGRFAAGRRTPFP
jgi:hypothetical protein